MNNNILNLGLKSISAILVIVGIILTVFVVSKGNPFAYEAKDITRLGTEVAMAEGAQDKMSQSELEKFILDKGVEIKEAQEKEVQSSVSTLIDFTYYTFIIVCIVLLLGALYSIIIEPKKYIIGIVSAVVFLLVVFIIYKTASSEVPAEYILAENKSLADDPDFVKAFTPDNWKLVSAALTTTLLLLGIAISSWIVGSVMKIVK